MKKTGLLAIMLTCALAFGFVVGCGQQGEKTDGKEDSSGTVTEDEKTDGNEGGSEVLPEEDKIDENTDVSALVSDKLSEEEWLKALSDEALDNFIMFNAVQPGAESTLMFEGENWYLKAYQENDKQWFEQMKIVRDDGLIDEYSVYYKDGETDWAWNIHEGQSQLSFDFCVYLDFLHAIREEYEKIRYDDEAAAYVYQGDKSGILGYGFENAAIYLKFKNGRLCAFGYPEYVGSGHIESESKILYISIYGYGKATVVAPN